MFVLTVQAKGKKMQIIETTATSTRDAAITTTNVSAGSEVTTADVAKALKNSPQLSHRADDEAVVARLTKALNNKGRAEQGWSRFTIANDF
jgi:hypothetical protein